MGCVWYVACAARCQTLAAVSHCACVWVRKFGEGVFLLSLRMNEKKTRGKIYLRLSFSMSWGKKLLKTAAPIFSLTASFKAHNVIQSLPRCVLLFVGRGHEFLSVEKKIKLLQFSILRIPRRFLFSLSFGTRRDKNESFVFS